MSKKSFKGAGADLFLSSTPVQAQDKGTAKSLKINPVFKALIPPLSQEEFSQLEENLIKNGIREAISVWDETIIDGHNRHEIARKHNLPYTTVSYDFETEDEAVLWIIKNQFGRRNLSAYDRSVLALRLKPVIAEKAKEKQRGSGGAVCQNSDKPPIDTKRELAELAGVSHDTIAKVEAIEKAASPEVKKQLRRGDISIHKAYQDIRRGMARGEAAASPLTPPDDSGGTYNVIYADCPWKSIYPDSENIPADNQRPRIKLRDLKNLGIPAGDDAALFMWASAPMLEKALQVMSAWGFNYLTCAVWDKAGAGTGELSSGRHEMLLTGTKGKLRPPQEAAGVSSVYRGEHGGNTVKPAYYYDLIENMFPQGRYLELFSNKRHNEKWTVFGNQILSGEEPWDNENNI